MRFLFKNLLLNWPLFIFYKTSLSKILFFYSYCRRYSRVLYFVRALYFVRPLYKLNSSSTFKQKKPSRVIFLCISARWPLLPLFYGFLSLLIIPPLGILKFSRGGLSSLLIRLFGFDRVIMWKMSSRREAGWQKIRCPPIPFMPRSSMHVYIAVQSSSLLFVITRFCRRKSSWRAALSHCKQFFIYVFPKRFSRASLLISTTYLQNKIIMFCLELWFSLEKYEWGIRCSHSAVIIPNGIMKLQFVQ